MEQAVQEADRGGVLGQEPAPLVERPMAGDAESASFVGGGDEPEQELGAGVVERGEANFIDLYGCPHSSTYADPATMPTWAAG
jgi:hypothetical protein